MNLRGGMSDSRFKIEEQVADNDMVAARWSIEGTHDGTFIGIPATGHHITNGGIDLFRFQDGRIVEIWVNGNDLGLMQQLGAVPLKS